jgi:hypothetical protein
MNHQQNRCCQYFISTSIRKKLIQTITKLEKLRINNLIQNEQKIDVRKLIHVNSLRLVQRLQQSTLELSVCYISLFSHPRT